MEGVAGTRDRGARSLAKLGAEVAVAPAAEQATGPRPSGAVARVLGPPRLHHTIATGRVIAKEGAGQYALDTFPARWHPLIHTALAARTGRAAPDGSVRSDQLPRLAGEFTLEVIADADRL